MVAVLALAIARGPLVGGLAGAWAGLVLDLIPPAAGPLGGWMLVLAVAGTVLGRVAESYRPGPVAAMLLLSATAGVTVLLRAAVVWFAGSPAPVTILGSAVGGALWALLLAPLALLLVSRPARKVENVAVRLPVDRQVGPTQRGGCAMTDRVHARLLVLAVLVLSLVLTLAARAFSLQVVDSEAAVAAAEDNRIRELVVPRLAGDGPRPAGRPLVANRISLDLAVDRRELRRLDDDGDAVLDRLSELLGIDPEVLAARLQNCGTPDAQPQPNCWNGAAGASPVVARDVAIEAAGEVMADPVGFPAVEIERVPVRVYPGGSLAAHALGHVGAVTAEDLAEDPELEGVLARGRAGLELVYDEALRGTPGFGEGDGRQLGAPRVGRGCGTRSARPDADHEHRC